MGGLLSEKEFLHRVRSMDPYLFEQFVADIWEERGYNTIVRSGSGDRGIDVIATLEGEKQLIQVKRYSQSNKVGSQTVRNYATLYQQVEDASAVVVVTTSSFTDEARKLAKDLDVETIDGHDFFRIANSHAPSIAVEYLHQSKSQAEGENIKSDNRTGLITESPFSNQYNYAEIKRSDRLCLDCASSDVWQVKLRKGIIFTLVKCADCEAVWAHEGSWPSIPLGDWNRISHEDDLEKKEKENDPCFIATAAYGTSKAEEIDILRNFRDRTLNQHIVGKFIIKLYYTTSPPIADWIRKTPRRRNIVRKYFVAPLVKTVEKFISRRS